MMMGLGLSLTNTANRSPQPSGASDTICKAIKDRKHVVATINDGRVLLEPYAVFSVPGDGLVLEAVRVLGAAPGWNLERLPLTTLQNVQPYQLGFIPNGAFDPAAYAGAICVVEPIQNIEDTLEAHTG